ncbi:hypothetical protein KF707_00035 [Candidatus Obscuribacterales bacterium]|nr:hypothetical protein [Candidatus Obscuribacterales bacterium]
MMSEQRPDEQSPEEKAAETIPSAAEASVDKREADEQSAAATLSLTAHSPQSAGQPAVTGDSSELKGEPQEVEWIPGEELELIRIPPPTIWPATLALGTTGIAFGVVTHWILSLAGLFLFLLGAAGWIEDMRKDVLQ